MPSSPGELRADILIAWLYHETAPDHVGSVVLRDMTINRSVGYAYYQWFKDKKSGEFPKQLWFNRGFLDLLLQVDPQTQGDYTKGREFGELKWRMDFRPEKGVVGDRQFVKCNYLGTQYVWELKDSCVMACHTLGEWQD